MISLKEKVDSFIQTAQAEDNFSSLGTEIIEDIKHALENLNSQTGSDDQKKDMRDLWTIYSSIPDSLFFNHSQELLEMLFEIKSSNIYKTFHDTSINFCAKGNIEIEPQSLNEVLLLMLTIYLQKVSPKEVLLYLGSILERKNKDPQFRLLLIELLCWVLKCIGKKEVFLPELLPKLLRLLDKAVRKYVKYKKQIENKEYVETPEHIQEYVTHLQVWIQSIVSKLLKTIKEDYDNLKLEKSKTPFVEVSSIYQGPEIQYIKDNIPKKENLIIHYYVLFILDYLNSVLNQGRTELTAETQDLLAEALLNLLKHFHNSLQSYISNYVFQMKIKEVDQTCAPYNIRDPANLLVGPYHVLSFYNTISIAHLVIVFLRSPQEASLLTSEYKLKLILPCINELFKLPSQRPELKEDLLTILNNLLDDLLVQSSANNIENLNKFNISLDEILEKILDYAGGPVEEKHKTLGIEIFNKIKKLLSEKYLAKLILTIVTTTNNYALSGHLVTEFKVGITNALKTSGGGAEIKNTESSFLNINNLRVFFELGIFHNSTKYKDDNDLIGACVNTLMLIYLKYLNLIKNIEGYMALEFKDHCNVFRPGNLRVLLHYGEKAIELQKKINGNLEVMAKQLEEMQKDSNPNPNLEAAGMRFNSLIMIYDSIGRIEEVYNELKSYVN